MTDEKSQLTGERTEAAQGTSRAIKVPIRGPEIQTDKGGDFTGRCYQCGSSNLWDDETAYGCNDCGMLRCFG